MVGTSSGTAPKPRRRTDSEGAWSLVRGTRTRQPKSGLVSNHDSVSRRSTTLPTTVIAGGAMRAARASAAMCSSVETTVACSVVVPTRVIATGVSGERPAAIRSLAMSPIMPTAESSTRVRSPAYCFQSTFSPQVTTETSRLSFVVSGMPAYAGTAPTDETPGTISKPMPALATACASSGPEA